MKSLNEKECLLVSAGVGFTVHVTVDSTYEVLPENATVVTNSLVQFLVDQSTATEFIDALALNSDLTMANITFLELIPH